MMTQVRAPYAAVSLRHNRLRPDSAIIAPRAASGGHPRTRKARMMTADRTATGTAPGGLPVPGGNDGGTADREDTDATLGLARAAYSPVDAGGCRRAGGRPDARRDPSSSVDRRARRRPARGREGPEHRYRVMRRRGQRVAYRAAGDPVGREPRRQDH